MPEFVVVVGMTGVGKSTVGAVLAARLGWKFVDTDDLASEAVGCDFADYIRSEGIDAARRAECAAVATLPDRSLNTVVAVGGGTVLDPDNRATLAALGRVVWLRAGTATLVEHLQNDTRDRPLLAGDLRAALDRFHDERSEFYAAVATDVVDVDGRTPDDAAAEVLKALRTPA